MIALPTRIYLNAMNKHWRVSYVTSPGKLIIVEQPRNRLTLYGKRYSKKAAFHLLARWVRLKAHDFLTKLVIKLNRRIKVKYKKLIIGAHETQWGSFSSTKTMSLNYHLIFLPQVYVRHIIYHELCHAGNLSHSEKFWKELGKYDKNWKKNRAELKDADKYIPDWVP